MPDGLTLLRALTRPDAGGAPTPQQIRDRVAQRLRGIDTNNDGTITQGELDAFVATANGQNLTAAIGLGDDAFAGSPDRDQLITARNYLSTYYTLIRNNPGQPIPPPPPLVVPGPLPAGAPLTPLINLQGGPGQAYTFNYNIAGNPLLIRPTVSPLAQSLAATRMQGSSYNIDPGRARAIAQQAWQEGGGTINGLVRRLFENDDPSGMRIIRMEELVGAFQLLTTAEQRTQFWQETAQYIRTQFAEGARQDAFDSFLALISSTDWNSLSGIAGFREFMFDGGRTMAGAGPANSVFASYNGNLLDRGAFTSMSLIRDAAGNLQYIETSLRVPQTNLMRYITGTGTGNAPGPSNTPGPGNTGGPGMGGPSAPGSPPAPNPQPQVQPQTQLQTIQTAKQFLQTRGRLSVALQNWNINVAPTAADLPNLLTLLRQIRIYKAGLAAGHADLTQVNELESQLAVMITQLQSSILGAFIPNINATAQANITALGLQSAGDGSFTKTNYSGRYFVQSDGSIFYTGGMTPSGAVNGCTYRGGSWHNTRPEDYRPMAGTIPTANTASPQDRIAMIVRYMELVQVAGRNGVYRRPGFNGEYIAQRDGSIFHTASGWTYENFAWNPSGGPRRAPMFP
ncbi:MAG: hypothetical protein HY094_04255 [Candidatus Melainabacteria bacterium]|nr:hypothetical protein [Candidatus Melainabacteria bacterium]